MIDVEVMVADGLATLDKFEQTGDRSGFRDWLDKYSDKIEEIREADDCLRCFDGKE